LTEIPLIDLNDGHQIPQLGFGVFQIPADETCSAVCNALKAGYRHIDTAQMYGNEAEVGHGIREAGIPRNQVFVTSKLGNGDHEPDAARQAFEQTLTDLDTEYVDLFLIHWPLPTRYDGDFVSTWKVFEEFQANGNARSIGVSNFQKEHLQRLEAETATLPAVNQIEVHPYHQNRTTKAWGEGHGIVTEAWSPIAQGDVLDDPVIGAIAEEHGKTTSQVTLRWHVQHGNVIFPKSVHVERMEENLAIFDFELSPADMAKIDDLDRGEEGRKGPHPDTFDRV